MEPMAPPVMMIGPSAPNGPPEPIEIAADSGFSTATLGSIAAAVHQNGFDGFGNAVAADALRAVTGHQSHDQCSGYWCKHGEPAQVRIFRQTRALRETPEIKNVGEKRNQAKQHQSTDGRERPDRGGQRRDPKHLPLYGKIAKAFLARHLLFFCFFVIFGHDSVLLNPRHCATRAAYCLRPQAVRDVLFLMLRPPRGALTMN